jgi:hypothetical protein
MASTIFVKPESALTAAAANGKKVSNLHVVFSSSGTGATAAKNSFGFNLDMLQIASRGIGDPFFDHVPGNGVSAAGADCSAPISLHNPNN